MDDLPHVRLVNPHAKGHCGNHHLSKTISVQTITQKKGIAFMLLTSSHFHKSSKFYWPHVLTYQEVFNQMYSNSIVGSPKLLLDKKIALS